MLLPGTIKKMLGIFRGKVTPVFIFISTVLGFWFGIMPGFSGLHLAIIAAVLIFNVNIGLFIISSAFGKLICLAAAPLLYHTGVVVHNGLWPLLLLLANTPIIGITNFDRYAVAGGLVIGPAVGAVAGIALVWLVIRFRTQMVKLERKSPAFKKWYSKWWVRILDRILIGKRTTDMESLFTVKKKAVRMPGLIIVVILFVLISVILPILADGLIREHTETALSWTNGAEVNIRQLRFSPLTGNVSMSNLAVTDPENPSHNKVYVETMAAQAGVFNLLKGDFVLRNVELTAVEFDVERDQPGRIFRRERDPEAVPEPPEEYKPITDYIADAEKIYEWFETLSKWLPEKPAEKTQPRQIPEKYLEYLNAVADMPASPRILARLVELRGVRLPAEIFGTSQITVKNASDAPHAARLPMQLKLKSDDTDAVVDAVWDYSVRENPPAVYGSFAGIDLSALAGETGTIGGLNFRQGTASGEFAGHLTAEYTDLTIEVKLSDLDAAGSQGGIFGFGSSDTTEIFSAIDEIEVLLHITGPTKRPSVSVDAEKFMEQIEAALTEAGKTQLRRKITDQLPDEFKDIEETEDIIEGFRGIFNR